MDTLYDFDSINAHLYQLFMDRRQRDKALYYLNQIEDSLFRFNVDYCDLIDPETGKLENEL